ncbi:MAG: 1-acyl-sn-glycerol-3-phosphate acyltransferase [bacterium]
MLPVIRSILQKTAGEVTVSGIENIEKGKGYVFIANHRDIILDSSILALHLVNHGHETCKITWGDNLMISPLVVDIGKVNRMITVFREGSPKEIFKNSLLLSAYIRESVIKK